MNICDEEMLEGAKLNKKKVFIVKIFKRKEQKKDFFFF